MDSSTVLKILFGVVFVVGLFGDSKGQVEKTLVISDASVPNGYAPGDTVTVTQNQRTTFTCTASTLNNIALEITWTIGADSLASDKRDANTSVVTFSPRREHHNRSLVCSLEQDDITRGILILVEGPPNESMIEKDTDYLVEDKKTIFTCSAANGYPAPTMMWEIDKEDADSDELASPRINILETETTGSRESRYSVSRKLEITPSREDNNLRIECLVNHTTETREATETLDVYFCATTASMDCPEFILNGTQHDFECLSSEANPWFNFQWYLQNNPLDKKGCTLGNASVQYGGFIRASTTSLLVTSDHNGEQLQCRLGRLKGNGLNCDVTDECRLNVHYQPVIQPVRPVNVLEGLNITIQCNVDANPEPLTNWTRSASPDAILYANNVLQINQASREDAGTYVCKSSNDIGEVMENVDVFVNYNPTFTSQIIEDVLLIEGDNLTLSCEVGGFPRPSITWFGPNGTILENGANMFISERIISMDDFHPIVQSHVVIRDAVIGQHNGTYRCEATNEVGAQTISMMVTVNGVGGVGGRSTSGAVIAGLVVIMLVFVIAGVSILVVKKRRRRYSLGTPMYQVGISSQSSEGRPNSVIPGLADNRESNDYTDGLPPRPPGKEAIAEEASSSAQVERKFEDSTYANFTANFTFPRENLEIFKELGHGAFGKVLLGKAKNIMGTTGETEVAVKTLKEEAPSSDREDLLREVDLMKTLKPHQNVVRLLGCCTETDPVYVIVEYMANGNLKKFLREGRNKKKDAIYDNLHGISASLSLMQLITFAKQTAMGMEYLSSQKCIHRDLAARNVLVNDELICKVSDFGLARDVMNVRVYQRQREEFRLPIRWMGLESLVESIFTTESDVWSFGILLWEIITLGARPYPGTDTKDVVSGLKLGMRMPCPTHCPPEIYAIMESCWNADPSERPPFASIVTMLNDLLEMELMNTPMESPEESLYATTGKSLDNEKL